MSESQLDHFPSHLVQHPLLPGVGGGLGTGHGAKRLRTRWDGNLVFRWALLSIVAAAILVQPRRSSTSSCAVSAAHLERRSKALWSIWHLPGGGCPTPVGCCRGWGWLLPTHIPSVMQPFVASMEVVGVPLGSGQPMVLRVASWWLTTGLHRSGGVPTDGQQVSIPLCRFVSLWGAVCLLTL